MASLQNGNQKGMKEVFKLLTCITQFGINMLVPTVLCFLLGLWLDKRLGTSFLAVLLFFVGAAAGAFVISSHNTTTPSAVSSVSTSVTTSSVSIIDNIVVRFCKKVFKVSSVC